LICERRYGSLLSTARASLFQPVLDLGQLAPAVEGSRAALHREQAMPDARRALYWPAHARGARAMPPKSLPHERREALKLTIKLGVDGGEYEGAAALLEGARSTGARHSRREPAIVAWSR
jgi:hypothetical protein